MAELDHKDSIAIIGGGVTGIASALDLAKSGKFDVTLIEKENKLGGLSSSYKWEDIVCDRFYHVVLSTDSYLLKFINDIGLGSHVFWHNSRSGFFGEGRLVSLSSLNDFVHFPFLSLREKLKLGLGILHSIRIKEPLRLKGLTAGVWLTRVFGREVYERIWRPLLRSKFGDASEGTSATLIWATINRLYGARSFVRKKETMGYVGGGYDRIWNAVQKRMAELKVEVVLGARVCKAIAGPHGYTIIADQNLGRRQFDKILFTIPSPELPPILGEAKNQFSWKSVVDVEYLGVLCVLLILKRSLSPYYVINLLDEDLPFTGIIESTNVIPYQQFGGRQLVYLPRYIPAEDPLNGMADEQIIALFVSAVKKVFGNFTEADVVHKTLFREPYAQPMRPPHLPDFQNTFRTPWNNVYCVNNSFISDSTINNNAAVCLARKAVQSVLSDLERREE